MLIAFWRTVSNGIVVRSVLFGVRYVMVAYTGIKKDLRLKTQVFSFGYVSVMFERVGCTIHSIKENLESCIHTAREVIPNAALGGHKQ